MSLWKESIKKDVTQYTEVSWEEESDDKEVNTAKQHVKAWWIHGDLHRWVRQMDTYVR